MDKDTIFYRKVINFIKQEATKDFGYCGITEGDSNAMLNTGEGNIIINIKKE